VAAKKWDKEKVIAAIHELQRQGVPLTSVWREDQSLWSAAHTYLGNWRKALLAAGVSGFRPHVKWSRESVLNAIRTRHRQGSLSTTWKEERGLYGAAKLRFGSWRKALSAAGIETKLGPPCKWSKEIIVERIRERHRRGLPLTGMRNHDDRLHAAALRHFGTWNKAIDAAEVPIRLRKSWTRESVIGAIRFRHSKGLPLTNVVKHDPTLSSAAYSYFGCWRDAMLAAGLDPGPRRRWTRQRLVDALRSWYPQGKLKGNVWEEDAGLVRAVGAYFGSWYEGLKAAGIEPPRRIWTRELILQELRTWRLGPCKTGLWQENPSLARAAARYFGSYDNALQAAGLEPRPRGRTAQQLIEAIQDRYVQGARLSGPASQADIRLRSSAARRFGSWRKALSAAGLHDVLPPPRIKWTRERVLAEIHCLYEMGTPRAKGTRRNTCLDRAAVRHFGSWKAAVEAAGYETTRRSWCKESLIAAIQERHRKGLPIRNMRRHYPALEASAVAYFGTWGKALQAAGFEPVRRAKWSRERVIAEIRRWNKEDRPLTRVWKEYPTLTAAAFKYFGTWRKALEVAMGDFEIVRNGGRR